jgi:heme/copper-type cytochrome/quinol oxidase subunit 2
MIAFTVSCYLVRNYIDKTHMLTFNIKTKLVIVALMVFGCVLAFMVTRGNQSGIPMANWKLPQSIEARGKRLGWHFRYSGPDGILGSNDDVQTDKILRVPEGVKFDIQLRSDDYIYVFSCPELELKEIAVPDLEFALELSCGRPGEYDLIMSPLCGFRLPPGELMGKVIVDSKRDFTRWFENQQTQPNR